MFQHQEQPMHGVDFVEGQDPTKYRAVGNKTVLPKASKHGESWASMTDPIPIFYDPVAPGVPGATPPQPPPGMPQYAPGRQSTPPPKASADFYAPPVNPEPAKSPEPMSAFQQNVNPELLAALAQLLQSQQQPSQTQGTPGAVQEITNTSPSPVYASADNLGLDFLTYEPSRPRAAVIFDLGAAGVNKVHYHAVLTSSTMLSLIYDDRYDGDRYIPPKTENERPFQVEIPSQNIRVYCFHQPAIDQALGCLDIVNLLIVDKQEAEELQAMGYDHKETVHEPVHMEKRNVIEPGRTPEEQEETREKTAELDSHVLKRLAEAMATKKQ